LFLKPVGTNSTAKEIRLPAHLFTHRITPWNKDSANGVLYHLILARLIATAAENSAASSYFSKGLPQEIIEQDQQPCD
jgi:hypothetical protein